MFLEIRKRGNGVGKFDKKVKFEQFYQEGHDTRKHGKILKFIQVNGFVTNFRVLNGIREVLCY